MRKLAIFIVMLSFLVAGTAFAGETYFQTNKQVSVAGDCVVAAPGISGKQFVLDAAVLQDGSTTAATITVYYGSNLSGPATTGVAVATTTVTFTNSSAAAYARTGDIIYEISRATDPSQTSFLFHGVVTASAFSDTANTEAITRAASNSDSVITTADTIHIGFPLYGVRGTAATDLNVALYAMTLETDNKEVYILNDSVYSGHATTAGVVAADGFQAGGATDYIVPAGMVPKGRIDRDWILRWNTGAGVDGEIDFLMGHYVEYR